MKENRSKLSFKNAATVILGLSLIATSVGAQAIGWATLFANLQAQGAAAAQFLTFIMSLSGGGLVAYGLFNAYKASDDHANISTKQIAVPLIVGGCMLSFGLMIGYTTESVGGTASTGKAAVF